MKNRSNHAFTNKALLAAAMGALLVGCSPDTDAGDGASSSSRSAASRRSVTSATTASSAASSIAAMERATYTDGTYSAEGTYRSPGGAESVGVTVTLEDGIVTAATFTPHATLPKSVTMQGNFAAGYEAYVVGKSLDEISLTVVNGSSLTGKGFMDALTQIKAEATAS